jgi:glutamyl-tRNA synthetase
MTVVTRFAPSPTGYLHIGGARTALFNWLYTRHLGGTFRLRIEDTDRARSTDEAIKLIIEGLKWLGIDWDGGVVMQFARANRHAEVARQLLAEGKAYYCYCTPQELEEMRTKARLEGKPMRYDGRWRDRDPKDGIPNVPPVIRLKAPQTGETVIDDLVQGRVTVANEVLDDMVLLRADGTPTYMHSVVVDDHDMEITHVIRGDDHLNNAFRQYQLYQAAGSTARTAPSSRSAMVRSASRPIATWATCPRRCATTCCVWAGAMATTRSSRPAKRSSGSTSRTSAATPRASTSPSSTT